MNLKLLWYCTKSDLKLYKTRDGDYTTMKAKDNMFGYEELNGKIVAVSDYEVEKIELLGDEINLYYGVEERACLERNQIEDYFGYKNDYKGYAIHIKNLYKFIKPKELKDLYIKGTYNNAEQMFTDEIQINSEWFHPMTKSPQNMCYVYDKNGNKYVLISVRPEWLAMILNGLKTIEVRRKVLKEML